MSDVALSAKPEREETRRRGEVTEEEEDEEGKVWEVQSKCQQLQFHV